LSSASRRLTRRVAEPARSWVAMRRGGVHAGQRGMVLTPVRSSCQSVGSAIVNLAFLIGRWSPRNLRTFQDARTRPCGKTIWPSIEEVPCNRMRIGKSTSTSSFDGRLGIREGVMLNVYLWLLLAVSDPLEAWAETAASSGYVEV
jgi:hypothetical protein